MYIKRAIDETLRKAQRQTKVMLLTGARQVGKSTAIQHIFPEYSYITLDDENELKLAERDRTLFFQGRQDSIIIDEVQYVPELFRSIKQIVDRNQTKGQIFLTGSQTYELMDHASESLSGRISIIEMTGLSLRERWGTKFDLPFLPTTDYIVRRAQDEMFTGDPWELIHRGCMPELLDEERDWEWFYRDYIRTYLERDVRKIINVRDEIKFRQFLVSLAARSAQVVIYQDIANDIGTDIKTVQHWTSVVAGSGIIRLLPTYQNNAIKRAIKAPKLYFMDTGLLCYLVGWNTAQTAKNGAMSGSIFETFVVSEVIKSYLNVGKNLEHLYYYRDKDKREIDLILEDGDTLYPVEIKKGATVDTNWVKHFGVLSKIKDKKIGAGAVLCSVDHPVPVNETVMALPIGFV